jgi:hypothetical protein
VNSVKGHGEEKNSLEPDQAPKQAELSLEMKPIICPLGINSELAPRDNQAFGSILENPISCHVNEQKERLKSSFTLAQ